MIALLRLATALLTLALFALLPAAASADDAKGSKTVAVLPFELMDTSSNAIPERPDAVHRKRLQTITDIIAQAIAAKPGYRLVDIAPVRGEIATMPRFVDCTGCDTKLASRLGADLVVTGYVHKISLLIIDMAVTIRDVRTGREIENDAVSIRGDTDESWSHGARFIAKEKLLGSAGNGKATGLSKG